MPGKKTRETDIYVPVLNEKTIKKVCHWDLGLINSDWSLHRNYNQYVQDLLISYQQEAAGRLHFFNVLRFYLEDTTLDNNQQIESASLGLILHAYKTASRVDFSVPLCVTGSLCKNGEGGLSLKAVGDIEEKFRQFLSSLDSQCYDSIVEFRFICVAEKGETAEVKNNLETLLAEYTKAHDGKKIDILVFGQGDPLGDVLKRIVVKGKKRFFPLPALIAGGVVAIGLICSVALSSLQHGSSLIRVDYTGWRTQVDKNGSKLSLATIREEVVDALEMSYDIVNEGWVLIAKEFAPGALSEIKGIGFSLNGDSAGHTLEVKLEYPKGTTFGVYRRVKPVGDEWIRFRLPIEEFKCWWPETECIACNNKLDRSAISLLHFALSVKEKDTPGSGTVRISKIYFF